MRGPAFVFVADGAVQPNAVPMVEGACRKKEFV
jgi:hypothetical protein